MARNKIISLVLSIVMLIGMLPLNTLASSDDKALRSVYLHAQGENPQVTVDNSTVYMGEDADIYFAVDNPNKGEYLQKDHPDVIKAKDAAEEKAEKDANKLGLTGKDKQAYIEYEVEKAVQAARHKEPQFDMNGYTLRICFEADFFDFAGGDNSAPLDYTVPDRNITTSDTDNEELGNDTGTNVPQSGGYFVYKHGSGTYKFGEKTYKTAYITVFFSGGYVPQKSEEQLWYNLAKLSLTPKKTGNTSVFVDIDSGDEMHMLELFAKNQSDELAEQTFDFSAVNGGYHHINIKDRTKPAPPTAKPASGSYIEHITVELTHEDGLPIYYTVDGSEPAGSSTRIMYTEPIEVTVDTEIKVCSYRESDDKHSNSVSYTYKILPDRPYLFDGEKELLPDMNSLYTSTEVYVADKDVFGNIADGSEVYYTFAAIDSENPVIGDDPENSWVKVSKLNPIIVIDKNRTVKLITDKMGKYSDVAVYYFTIKPLAPVANYESGEYDEKIDVTLSSKTKGATIFYTTDGSDPKNGIEYTDIPITLARDTTLRAISYYEGEWSDKVSYYYLFSFYDDLGVDAFYPAGVYEGSVNVTLTPNNPDYTVIYRTDDGEWIEYKDVLVIDSDTNLTAKVVEYNEDGTIKTEGMEYTFMYKIKPLPPEFAPESTQFTNSNNITIYTPESTETTTGRFDLYYTLDGTDPVTSKTRIHANLDSDSAVVEINKYTVVTAVVLKDGVSYSNVVKHSYDIVTLKPVKPLTTLTPGYYIHEIGGEGYGTQFMPVPKGTTIYYTISYDGGLCPDPIPNTDGTYVYDGSEVIEIRGTTVIKAVAVNPFGVKSDVGIFSYTVTPEAPSAAPSATISGERLPVVPVDAVKGSTVNYKIGKFENKFVNSDDERFYIDTETGMAYRDEECTEQLGKLNTTVNTSKSATVEISSTLDGVESDINKYIYAVTTASVLAPPYADKETGIYEEKKIDDENNLLKVMLYSLNSGGNIQYRVGNEGEWNVYEDGLLFKEDTILQLRYEKDGKYSSVVSYVYNFIPLAPVIELPSGTYLENDNKMTRIAYDKDVPGDKRYNIFYRRNGDKLDRRYNNADISIEHTMSVKAYVLNEETGRVSKNTIHYYIIEKGSASSGSVYIAYPYDVDRISAHLLGKGDYAEGIRLLSQNKSAEIHYYYTYTKKSDGQTITTNTEIYDVTRPIIPTNLMEDISIVAWLEDENGKIEGSDGVFDIDFIHLEVSETSLEETGKVEFKKGTKYTIIDDYPDDDTIILYYTLDGSDPSDEENENRFIYNGEELSLSKETTVKTVYYSACGKCVECKGENEQNCWVGVYGEIGVYKYTIPTTISSGGGGGGGGKVVEVPKKYTEDIFESEHPTHIGYINGYPEGDVRPEGDITREEIAAILYRITNHAYEKPFVKTGEVFPDVDKERWSAHDIEYMAEKGIIEGYPEGDFRPSRNLTRAEFAALIFRFAEVEDADIKNPFDDLKKKHWAYDEILALVNSGLVEGYPDGTFRPEDNITRAEVMTVINKLLGRKPLEDYVKSLKFNPYKDLDEDEWYYVTVLEATITHNYWLDKEDFEYKWEDWK